ncbi:unnamed protein product [Brassicogethes aeneus]|uniref:Uncharacterized protein n=1 Tax=Brassicogethes aeneus TaxID=1431903 RepID=A0A9P0BFS2_BRAAE|nr:unnamed protein product [Brassicogethes aeneus]
MHLKVFYKLIWLHSLLYLGDSIGISGKLDFDDKPSIVKTPRLRDSLSYKTLKTYEKSGSSDFDDIGVVCVSGGCNTTKHGANKDSVETDVVVHVKTRVELKNPKIDDTPDIPVVTGYKGTNLETVGGNLNVQPLVVTNIDDELNRPQFIGTTESPYISASPYSSTSRSFVPYGNLNPYSTLSPINTYPTSSPSPYTPRYLYGIQEEPRVDLTIQSLPSVMNDFDRSLNQFDAYPGFIENNNRPKFYPIPNPHRNTHKVHTAHRYPIENGWDRKIPTYHRHSTNGINNCICKNEPGVDQQVFSSDSSVRRVSIDDGNIRRVSLGDPGTQINDKLAPLN